MDATKEAVVSWVNAYVPASSAAPSFESLADGHHFYRILSIAASYCFSEDKGSVTVTDNRILKKTNLEILVRDMNKFGALFLKANDGFDLNSTINVERVAKGEDLEGLIALSEYVFTMSALSGTSAIIEKLRTVPKDRQTVLNGVLKRVMTLHGFKKATPPATATATTAATVAAINNTPQGQPSGPAVTVKSSAEIRANDDPAMLRGELTLLKNELRDMTSNCNTAESKCIVAEQQLEQLQSRYRILLEQSESKGSTTKERELQQALAASGKKDDQINQLNGMIQDAEDNAKKLKNAKRQADEELNKIKTELENEKKKSAEMLKERGEALSQLLVSNDRANLLATKKDDLEKELLQKESEMSALRQKSSSGLNGSLNGRNSFVQGEDRDTLIDGFRAQINALENELALAKGLVGGGQSHDDANSDNLSNSSMAHAPGTNLGEGGASPMSAANNVSMIVDPAVAEELAATKRMLQESHAAIKRLEERLEEQKAQFESNQSTFQMKLRQVEDEAATKGAAALQKEIETLKAENAKLLETISLSDNSAVGQQEAIARQAADFQARFENGRKAIQAEQAVVTSVVFHCGQRNLALQQRGLLGGAAVPHAYRNEGFSSLFWQDERAVEDEMAVASGGAESFMSKARLGNLWGGVRPANAAAQPQPAAAKRR